MVRCKFCQESIIWLETANGKKMPVDATPEKRVVRYHRGDKTIAKVVDTFMPHFSTCANYESEKAS